MTEIVTLDGEAMMTEGTEIEEMMIMGDHREMVGEIQGAIEMIIEKIVTVRDENQATWISSCNFHSHLRATIQNEVIIQKEKIGMIEIKVALEVALVQMRNL